MHIAKWLLEIKPNINISVENEFAFKFACSNGHLNIAKWLLEIKPTININSCSNEFFKCLCSKNTNKKDELEQIKNLSHLFPNKYIIIIQNNKLGNK